MSVMTEPLKISANLALPMHGNAVLNTITKLQQLTIKFTNRYKFESGS